MSELKSLKGYKHEYLISDDGSIFSMASGRMKKLNPSLRGKFRNQYLFVRLVTTDGLVNKSIHRLVAENFVTDRPEGAEVINHKDGNKQNNHHSNLEWTTVSENTKHAYAKGLAGASKHGSFKGPVCSVTAGGFGYVFFGCNQAKRIGFDHSLVRRCIAKPGYKHAGHEFYRIDMSIVYGIASQLRAGKDGE